MENNKKIDINSIITLCYISDEFDNFEKILIPNISSKNNIGFLSQVCDISQGKFKLGAVKAKRFYEENKMTIDTINQYSDILTFINKNYDCHGKPTSDLRFFHEYLLGNKKEISKILQLLEKVKELGFREFEFNEKLDFTKEVYGVYSSLDDNFSFTYVANPQVIPSYTDYINFTTKDSNYKMELEAFNFSKNEISPYRRKLILNNLFFDPNSLPESIDIEHTHGHLARLKEEQQKTTNIIRNSVNLSISVLDLEKQFDYTNKTINRLEEIESKEKLVSVLTNMKEDLEKLKTLSIEYDMNVLKEEPLLTTEVLEHEKTLCLRRREWSKIDLC